MDQAWRDSCEKSDSIRIMKFISAIYVLEDLIQPFRNLLDGRSVEYRTVVAGNNENLHFVI